MLINQGTGRISVTAAIFIRGTTNFIAIALSTSSILLVPYEKSHVPTYHEWMKVEEIQIATASEPLTIEEEYAMQATWRSDSDKLTFIACLPRAKVDQKRDEIESGNEEMIGDVNLFLTPAEEDNKSCIGELELMIAPTNQRRKGYGRATILTFLNYLWLHLDSILTEYAREKSIMEDRVKLLMLRVKIGNKNEKSIKLFEGLGFSKTGEEANYFGEFELVLENLLGEERLKALMTKYDVQGYKEVSYTAQ